MLVIISGSSGCGKNTIISELIKRYGRIKYFKTCTTRPKRGENDNGYFFLKNEEFEKKIENGELFEYEQIHNRYFYGVLWESVEKAKKRTVYLRDVDVKGAMKLKKELGDKAKLVYLDVPKEELRKRIIKRGETPESAELRLSRYDFEKSFMDKYDLIIKNKNLDQTVLEIAKFLGLKELN